jgi:ABC-2 type transport system ATP-binding protein
MNVLELKSVSKKYKNFTLDNISFALPCGCIMGLVGENGAGKSTIIKLILDMIKRDEGEITIFGKDNRDGLRFTKEDIGVVLDEAYYPEQLNIREVNSFLKYTYKNWNEDEFFGLVRKFGLSDTKKFKDFSRGMKMKMAIAVALSHKAKLLILDEATSGLDPVIRDEILDIFIEFTRNEENSVLI